MNQNFQDAMTKGRKLQLLALFLALAVGGLVYAFMKPPDPVYRGKPLSVWVSSMTEHDAMIGRFNSELNTVIQELDQQGIKRLGEYVGGRSLSQRKYYKAVYDVLPGKAKRLFPAPDLKQKFRIKAAVILAELKQKARPAMPHLIAAVSDTELNGRVRELAARTLLHFGPDAEPGIRALTKALNDRDEMIVECAARALGAIGPAARSSLSVLESKLGDRRDYVTVALAEAIWQIDPTKADRLAPILRECVQHTNAYSRVYGSKILWAVSNDGATVVPVLTGVVVDTNLVSFHQWSIMLLGDMGLAASNAVPLLEAKTRYGGMFADSIQKVAQEALSKITNAP